MDNRIALIVVLYNACPKGYVFENIGLTRIVVDNTPDRDLGLEAEDLHYIPLGKNHGIAHALNVGFAKAKALGFEWVLTMDQDSLLPSNMIEEYVRFVAHGPADVGIVAPLINMYQGEDRLPFDSYEEVNEALTSGSLVSVRAFDAAGGFMEKLFIDEVDFEFCWHIRSLGYRIFQLNSVVMQHQLGETKEYRLFGKHLFYVMNEKPIRHYYMQRNQLYVRNAYKARFPELNSGVKGVLLSLFKILFFESQPCLKLKARYLGYKDYKNGVFGECRHRQLI